MGVGRVRGFLRGVFWGGVSGIAGLAVVSQLAGSLALQGPFALQEAAGAAQPQKAATDPREVKALQDDWEKIAPIPMPERSSEPPIAAAQSPAETPAPVTPDGAAAQTAPDSASAAPKAQGDLPITPIQSAPQVVPDAPSVPAIAGAKPQSVVAPVVDPVAAAVVPQPPAAPVPAKPQEVASPAVSNGVAVPSSAAIPKDAPVKDEVVVPQAPITAPDPIGSGTDRAVPAVPQALTAGSLLPKSVADDPVEASAPMALSTGGALQRYSRSFSNLEQKPLFTILLVDEGGDGVDRAALAAQDLPLTIVIDPAKPEALAQAKIWREGGQEVVLSGAGLPATVSGADYGAALKALADGLPEAVALVDLDGRTFQNDLGLAAEIVPFLAQSGRGLVTLDQGANPADQSAKREGLPHGRIFRKLDVDRETADVVARYLDRAAFKAAQEGRVAVLGHLRPDTISGIMQWAVEGRAASVSLAPVSALLAK